MSAQVEPADSAQQRLRWLEVVTDTGLAQLGVDRLLDELLDKVRGLMVVDTAAVLLLDPSHQFLMATAARGIEEEVHPAHRSDTPSPATPTSCPRWRPRSSMGAPW